MPAKRLASDDYFGHTRSCTCSWTLSHSDRAKPSGLAREQISQIFESLAIKSPFKTSGPEGLPPGLPNLNLILRLPFLNVFL
jgi:hypothetical protein